MPARSALQRHADLDPGSGTPHTPSGWPSVPTGEGGDTDRGRGRGPGSVDREPVASEVEPRPEREGHKPGKGGKGARKRRRGDPASPDGSASADGSGHALSVRSGKGAKKAERAAREARLVALETAVADLGARLDALAQIVDEAVRASIATRPKATTVVPRTRARKA